MRRGESGLNLLLAVDKPCGMTSHDVVNHVRRGLGERRVGHAGTLDPAASGVMIVGVGQGTRLMGMLTLDQKSYGARIAFGTETETDDAEGEVVRTAPVLDELRDEDFARRTVAGLVGEIDQVPPAYSAISVGGRRSYALAREGKAPELPARHVEIVAAQLLAVRCDVDEVAWDCAFTVSKGTYVRSIARDLGRQLGSAAHLAGLRRTASGGVTLRSCLDLGKLEAGGAPFAVSHALDPARALGVPVRVVRGRELNDVANGRSIACDARVPVAEGSRVAVVADDRLLGVWERRRDALRPVANFPQGIVGCHVE